MDLTPYVLFGMKDAIFNDFRKNTLQDFKPNKLYFGALLVVTTALSFVHRL